MTIIGDVLKELFKMFVADLRLTIAVLIGVGGLATLRHATEISPMSAGLILLVYCLAVLSEAVYREAKRKKAAR
ncbi:hypothetical protein HH303_15430 [Rhodospirillaceae bacterium KN72]|uniref:Uncharacterized protein n=1 Tax=Pacificispira spongiicola TaxID=2729598 RepID=A0A7Y0E2C7_9PROT|nr:hypothetical protein [Pacificispira spongiicola]NMM45888.1 hypothetical protein [Pacificispira spongiicola]